MANKKQYRTMTTLHCWDRPLIHKAVLKEDIMIQIPLYRRFENNRRKQK